MSDRSFVSANDGRGQQLARFAPPGVGLRLGYAPVNASWPFPRSFEIYETGILVRSLGSSAWIPRGSIGSMRHGPGYIRIKWSAGGATQSATVSSWFSIKRIEDALEQAGYAFER